MTQVLEQKKKQVTFEELCPQWSEAIRTGRLLPGLGASTTSCIVGEAHGFDARYSYAGDGFCGECWNMSTKLVNSSKYATISLEAYLDQYSILHYHVDLNIKHEQLEVGKERFMKHWNEAHVGPETD